LIKDVLGKNLDDTRKDSDPEQTFGS